LESKKQEDKNVVMCTDIHTMVVELGHIF